MHARTTAHPSCSHWHEGASQAPPAAGASAGGDGAPHGPAGWCAEKLLPQEATGEASAGYLVPSLQRPVSFPAFELHCARRNAAHRQTGHGPPLLEASATVAKKLLPPPSAFLAGAGRGPGAHTSHAPGQHDEASGEHPGQRRSRRLSTCRERPGERQLAGHDDDGKPAAAPAANSPHQLASRPPPRRQCRLTRRLRQSPTRALHCAHPPRDQRQQLRSQTPFGVGPETPRAGAQPSETIDAAVALPPPASKQGKRPCMARGREEEKGKAPSVL